jgi:DNA-binding protein YbaB
MSDGMPKDLLGGDPADIERGLDEWVAGFERNAARLRELRHRVDEVRLTATSASGVVTVTVDANGTLTDVRFTDRIIQTTPDELRRQLLDAVKQAKSGIVDTVREIADETVDADSAGRIAGYYGQRSGGIGEPGAEAPESEDRPARSRRGDADDDFGEDSIFDSSRES